MSSISLMMTIYCISYRGQLVPCMTVSNVCTVCLSDVCHVDAVIVFDGFTEGHTTTKYAAHLRAGVCKCVKVNFTGGMIIQSTKEEFLSNVTNKQRFILFLSDKLRCLNASTIMQTMMTMYSLLKHQSHLSEVKALSWLEMTRTY
jgi:hypothetical protein